MDITQTSCNRCGSCCMNGGPALHSDDKKLILDGSIPLSSLITIRKGELVHHPIADRFLAAGQELIKIRGTGKQWTCHYYDADQQGCSIYNTRPQACRVLKCWDTTEIEQLIDQDTLNRFDLIEPDDPLYAAFVEHESLYPCPNLESILKNGRVEDPEQLELLANHEIGYRTTMVAHHRLTLRQELFYFGRPLFQLFSSVGAVVREAGSRLLISWPDR